MSTDFSIKPVGAPAAAPITPPVSEAVQSAVATELPASQSVTAADASVRVRINSARRQRIRNAIRSLSIATPLRSSIRWSTTGRARW